MSNELALPLWKKQLAYFLKGEEGEAILKQIKDHLFKATSNDQLTIFKEQGKREFVTEIENAINLVKRYENERTNRK